MTGIFPANLQDYLALQRVAREFGLRMHGCRRLGDKVVVETDAGLCEVRPLRYSPDEYSFVCGAAEFLRGQGFTRLPEVVWTPAGRPYALVGGIHYGVRRLVPGKPADLDDPGQLAQAAEMLAWFHRCGAGYHPAGETSVRVEWGSWPRRFAAVFEHLRQYEVIARTKSERDRFSRLFLRLSAEYAPRASACLEALATGAYQRVVAGERERGGLCHGGYLGRNLIGRDDGALFLDDFEDLTQETRLEDLGCLLTEHGHWDPKRLLDIIEVYNGIAPLNRDDLACLRVYLDFPFDLLQVAEAHEQGLSQADQALKRLASEIGQRDAAIESLGDAPVKQEEPFATRVIIKPVERSLVASEEPGPPSPELPTEPTEERLFCPIDSGEPEMDLEQWEERELPPDAAGPASVETLEEAGFASAEAPEEAGLAAVETADDAGSLPELATADPDAADSSTYIAAVPGDQIPAEAPAPVVAESAPVPPAHLVWRPFPAPLQNRKGK